MSSLLIILFVLITINVIFVNCNTTTSTQGDDDGLKLPRINANGVIDDLNDNVIRNWLGFKASCKTN